MLSTIHNANEYVMVKRKEKIADKWESIDVKQPKVISEYNSFMNGVDKSDQILSSNNLLRKCFRWWKTLFFHLIDIAIVNGFILFQDSRKQGKLNKATRPRGYSLLSSREELVRYILDIPEFAEPPIYRHLAPAEPKIPITHIPDFTSARRNCHNCYEKTKKEYKVSSFCPDCKVYLHCNPKMNCFAEWHRNKSYWTLFAVE